MSTPTPTGRLENHAVLDLTAMNSADDLAAIEEIANVSLLLVRESLVPALTAVPMRNIAATVPVPDGADLRVHTGSIVMGGDALGDPANDEAVLVVTGTLVISGPVERVTFRRVVVTGLVLAPSGSEGAVGAGLHQVTGSVEYYRHSEGQRVATLSGQTRLSGDALANAGGTPDDVLVVAGQTIVTGPVASLGYQRIVAQGQLVLPRASEAVLAPAISVQGQTIWYEGVPRIFVGEDRFAAGFLELLDEPTTLVLIGEFGFDDDVTTELLRDRVTEIVLVGELRAAAHLVPVLQLLTTERYGTITAEPVGDGG